MNSGFPGGSPRRDLRGASTPRKVLGPVHTSHGQVDPLGVLPGQGSQR